MRIEVLTRLVNRKSLVNAGGIELEPDKQKNKWATSYIVRFILDELHTISSIIPRRHVSLVQHSHNCLLKLLEELIN